MWAGGFVVLLFLLTSAALRYSSSAQTDLTSTTDSRRADPRCGLYSCGTLIIRVVFIALQRNQATAPLEVNHNGLGVRIHMQTDTTMTSKGVRVKLDKFKKYYYTNLDVSLMYYQCISHVLWMYYLCIIHVLSMHYQCIINVYLMYYQCIINVLSMYYQCIINVLSMYY